MILHVGNSVIDTAGMDLEQLLQLYDELEVAMDKLTDVLDLMEP